MFFLVLLILIFHSFLIINYKCEYLAVLCPAKQGYIPFLKKNVDPEQLASKKPADQDPHFFPLRLLLIIKYEIYN